MSVSITFSTLIVNSKTKIIALLVLTELLVACSGHKPASTTVRNTVVRPKVQNQASQIKHYQPSPKLYGQSTVDDVLQTYGDHVAGNLSYYFSKAKVAYPPREITFVALKQEKKLELWARDSGAFRFIRDYYIMAASGESGPKLRQGDRQVPEGVYRITSLNPNSNYHLSMKINYPNEFDLFHAEQEGRSNPGGDIFIHGKAASIGCLAMGDAPIEELFVLTALVGAENVKVVIAPRDPRTYPLKADSQALPEWTSALYSTISNEIKALSPVKPSYKH